MKKQDVIGMDVIMSALKVLHEEEPNKCHHFQKLLKQLILSMGALLQAVQKINTKKPEERTIEEVAAKAMGQLVLVLHAYMLSHEVDFGPDDDEPRDYHRN